MQNRLTVTNFKYDDNNMNGHFYGARSLAK